jgi:hypothetical protein
MLGRNRTLEEPPNIPEFLTIHYVIRCEHLIAKYFKFENVIKIIP